jgi:hypothetical protein
MSVESITVQPELFRLVVQPGGLRIISVAAQGPPGVNGIGVPPGGTTGQVLVKLSDADFDVGWATVTVEEPGAGENLLDFSDADNSMYVSIF